MKNSIAFILAGGQGERLYPLTKDRAKPAVPFGGIYRIIDFTLSNCVNSELKRIFVLTQYKSFALDRHITLGWNSIFNIESGEFLHPMPPQFRMKDDWYLGTADSVYHNLYSLKATNPGYVFILSGDHVYKMDYRKMLRFHKSKDASVTIGLYEVPIEQASQFGVLEVNSEQRIIGFEEKPQNPKPMPTDSSKALISMGVYLFNTEALVASLMVDAEDHNSGHDFGRDVIPKMFEGYRVYGYPFEDENKGREKYWRDVGTIDEYYKTNLDLVEVDPIFNFYDKRWPIRTLQPQFPPAKTVFSDFNQGRVGLVLQSVVAPGTIISGGRVYRSILSHQVHIHSYTDVSESILMEGVEVNRYAKIRRAIIDKWVKIPENMEIGYNLEEDRKRFFTTESGIVVIPKEEKL
ncbi:MAG: glucose-1-phosphate adenylyltransferase [candidate division WOR-3 bacterium]|nr:glucose-1-phosphate adenylyltransferase [candidate division WOR-3 bacterium]